MDRAQDRVLAAATELFAARGFRGTSTRDLAVRARVSEVTLFRLFKNKQELYLRVLDTNLGSSVPDWLVEALESSPEDRVVFARLADALHEVFTPVFIRLVLFAALEHPELLDRFLRPRLTSFYNVVSDYIVRRMEAGSLRPMCPPLAARALVGLVFYHQILDELLGGRKIPGHEVSKPVQIYLDIWMRGVFADSVPVRSAK